MNNLPKKTLLMAIIEKDGSVLMRKKPAGSPPYEETWYIFGCDRDGTQEDTVTRVTILEMDNLKMKIKSDVLPNR